MKLLLLDSPVFLVKTATKATDVDWKRTRNRVTMRVKLRLVLAGPLLLL